MAKQPLLRRGMQSKKTELHSLKIATYTAHSILSSKIHLQAHGEEKGVPFGLQGRGPAASNFLTAKKKGSV
jgi:hypothetical protein